MNRCRIHNQDGARNLASQSFSVCSVYIATLFFAFRSHRALPAFASLIRRRFMGNLLLTFRQRYYALHATGRSNHFPLRSIGRVYIQAMYPHGVLTTLDVLL
ncbi:hypothetical protein NDU88_006619 [Pleurodeles waltl]|uniref:Uncharacterized protein n=1 Tax=Pleurodeles waltl TaxID=8319 RepID=A0AAV7RLY9_PLEWA|nr:hypothetical protein NDU88_006619 [Pleurodeles waltl]